MTGKSGKETTGIRVKVYPKTMEWILRRVEADTRAAIRRDTRADAHTDTPSEKALVLPQSWISGEQVPTFDQIEEVSRQTHIPFGFFFMKTPPRETDSPA